jgi:hypothetical protein
LNKKDVGWILCGCAELLLAGWEYGLLDAFDLQSSSFSFGLLLAFLLKAIYEA